MSYYKLITSSLNSNSGGGGNKAPVYSHIKLLPPKLRLHLFISEGVLPSSTASEGENTPDSQPSMAGTLAIIKSGTTPEKSTNSFQNTNKPYIIYSTMDSIFTALCI